MKARRIPLTATATGSGSTLEAAAMVTNRSHHVFGVVCGVPAVFLLLRARQQIISVFPLLVFVV